MKWTGISGSGRGITPEIEHDVRTCVREVFKRRGGIVAGGVLGVDYIATDEALRLDPTGERIRVCLPSTLEAYLAHFRARKDIISEEADMLERQLRNLQKIRPEAIIEAKETKEINRAAYEARNDVVISLSDDLSAFQVNESKGTQYTIDSAHKKRIPIDHRKYTVKT